MDFSYFNLDILSLDAAEVEKVKWFFLFSQAVINTYCHDVFIHMFYSRKMQIVICINQHIFYKHIIYMLSCIQAFPLALCDGDIESIEETDHERATTVNPATKDKAQVKKAKKQRKKKEFITADLRDLAKDALLQMKENEMLNALYNDDIKRLLEKPSPTFPSDTLKERFEKTCKKFSSVFITTAREAMWEEFSKIWIDEKVTKSIILACGITSDFCSWFLLYLQQVVAKRYLQCDSTAAVNNTDLSDAERESVAYISGAVLKIVSSRLCDLKRIIKSKGQDITAVDKDIAILNTCKDEMSDKLASTTTSNKLIKALNRGGLTYPKTSIINLFLIVEGIFRQKISLSSKQICVDTLLSESLGKASVQTYFLDATMHEVADHEQKFEILKKCVHFYIKVRCHAHAKYVIENYRVDTKTERKKKSLRKKLKLSDQDQQVSTVHVSSMV